MRLPGHAAARRAASVRATAMRASAVGDPT